MNSIKQYTIQINGIKESTDAVEALSKQLDNLEQRIDALNKKGVSISGALGGGKTSDLTAEQKIADQINQSMEKRVALQGELGKELAQEKQLMKEVNAEAKAAAASDRLANGGYGNTMMGLKQELYDIKAAMQTMEIGSNEFLQATQRADELNTKLKEIEQSYGQFGRNVGNYSNSIQEAFQQITVKVGDTEMKFNSTKEALRTLREGIKGMVVNGQEGTEEFKNMSDALHNLEMAADRAESAVQDLQKSSTGMDAALDWMQSFGALGQISQGFSSMFGGTGFEESIQKLMSLQSVLQGIEKIREQMNTGEGIGGVISKGNKYIDQMIMKLTGAKMGMKGLEMSTKSATIAVKGLSLAIKAIASLGFAILIEKAVGALEKLGSALKGADNSANDAVDSMSLVTGELEAQNLELENNIKLIDIKLAKGEISEEEAKRQKIEETNKVLSEQLDTMLEIARLNRSDDVYKQINNGVNALGTEDSIVNADNLKKAAEMWKTYHDAVVNGLNVFEEKAEENGQTVGNWLSQVGASLGIIRGDMEDTEEDFNKITQNIIGQFIGMGQQIINHTGEYTEQEKAYIQDLINAMDDKSFLGTILLNLDKYLGDAASNFAPIINSMKAQIRNIGSGLGLNGGETEEERKKRLDKELADIKKHNTERVRTAKSSSRQQLDVEKETQRMKLNLMAEGYQKELTRLKYEYQEKERRYKGHSDLLLLAQQEYEKKSEELREKYEKQTKAAYINLYQGIFSYVSKTAQQELEVNEQLQEKLRETAEKKRTPLMYDTIGFYENMFSNLSTDVKNAIKGINEYVDGIVALARYQGKTAIDATDIFLKSEKWINDVTKLYGGDYNEKKWDEVKKLFGENNVETFEDLVKYLIAFRVKEQSSMETFVENEEDLKKYYGKLLKRMDEKERKFIEGDVTLLYEEWMEERKKIIDEEYKRELLEIEEQYDKLAEETSNYYKNEIENTDKGEKYKEYLREQYQKRTEELSENYTRQQDAAYSLYQNRLNNVQKEVLQKRKEDLKSYFNDMQQEFRDYYEAIINMSEKMPKRNAFGFIQVSETNKGYTDTINNLQKLNNEVMQVIYNIGLMHSSGRITTEDFKNYTRELMRMVGDIQQKMKEAQQGLSWEGKLQDFFQTFSQYFSEVTSAIQQVWGELDNLANYNLDRQQDALDKENEMLQDKLDEQEEILERHKERVDSIEGQLADARGDRRERLIDALNEEIIAQRRAQSEKERLEKEQAKLEEKQKELDFQRELNQYYSGLRGILFNTAQAVMSAATNKWPVPAIPLMALAAAAGGAQYAIAHQQRPIKRAEGGMLFGKSHAEGGMPILGSNVEVEGGEYVIRKSSTKDNIELLDYINSSQKRVDLADMMEFFRHGGRTIINNTSKTRFADGGMLELADYPSFNLGSSFEAFANRPVVVSVQDINARQAQVRQVQVLANVN